MYAAAFSIVMEQQFVIDSRTDLQEKDGLDGLSRIRTLAYGIFLGKIRRCTIIMIVKKMIGSKPLKLC